ncbi:hypothetical protein G6F61_015234 [Rhizopus arrhizus]|nr:hypothetical protein G6F61_015234 [Rhizopus arrhizus]
MQNSTRSTREKAAPPGRLGGQHCRTRHGSSPEAGRQSRRRLTKHAWRHREMIRLSPPARNARSRRCRHRCRP